MAEGQGRGQGSGSGSGLGRLGVKEMTVAEIRVEDLRARVGQEVGVSGWVVVDQPLIDAFADLTGDRQFIHVDPDRARAEGPYGGPVAHGLLTLALLPRLAQDALPPLAGVRAAVNYGFDRVRFVAPVRAGARVRGRFVLARIEDRADGSVLMVWEVQVEVAGMDRPALVAEWLGLRYLDGVAA